jgi:hypothetical protein
MFRRRRSLPELKSYLYVSDSKVKMLYAQIPSALRDKIAVELKVDLKVVGASVKQAQRNETRYSKLRVVMSYLESSMPIGTVEEPSAYFRGQLPMRWGRLADDAPFTLFSYHGQGTYLGLVGSSRYITGSKGEARVVAGGDDPPSSWHVSQIWNYIQNHQNGLVQHLRDKKNFNQNLSVDTLAPEVDRSSVQVLEDVVAVVQNFRGPVQELEFVAARLLSSKVPENNDRPTTRAILGTPLYVALH